MSKIQGGEGAKFYIVVEKITPETELMNMLRENGITKKMLVKNKSRFSPVLHNYYKEANFLQRKYSNFSINEERKKFDYIKSLYNKKLFEKYKNCGYPDYKPIFIIGS